MNQIMGSMGSTFARLALAFGLGTITFLAARPAHADWCGAVGEPACTVNQRIPSCDVNLVEEHGTCFRPLCGAEGKQPCSPGERMKFSAATMTPVPAPCDQDLKYDLGKNICFHPPCGREGANACIVIVRVPSCDANLVERNGRCEHPACGRVGEQACSVTTRIPSCDLNLIEREGQCVRAGSPPQVHGATAPAPPPPPSKPPPPPGTTKPPTPPPPAPAPAPPPAGSSKPAPPPPPKPKSPTAPLR